MTEQQNQIIKTLNSFGCGISPYEIFSDWVKCCALALVNSATIFHGPVWQQREKEYVETLNKYKNVNAVDRFAEMLVLLAESLEVEINDALGEVLMHLDMGSKRLGQFFTPFHLSELVARLGNEKFIEGETITVNEPTCGGGGNIIALAKVLKSRGINYQTILNVVAQDIDWRCVYMCYTVLSLLGIKADVVQGDTLSEPYIRGKTDSYHVFLTPARLGALV